MWLPLLLPSLVSAHSWVECLSMAEGGVPVGFPRGNGMYFPQVLEYDLLISVLVPRTSPGFSDPAMTYQLLSYGPNLPTGAPICASTQQRPNQTEGSPALQAAPGSSVLLRYQENGHVTLPENSPGKPSPGKVFIYGTTSPSPTDLISSIHRIWNPCGAEGDQRGCLLGAFNFDDGQCFQVNGGQISRDRQSKFGHAPDPLQGSDLWCHNQISLPDDLHAGERLTLYWVWDWPTNPGTVDELQELYTTCIDIDMT